MPKTLEQLYGLVRSGYSILNEEVGSDDAPSVRDEEVAHMIPEEYVSHYVHGSAKLAAQNEDGSYSGSFLLKFPTSLWTDGTEEFDDALEYVEKAVQSNLFNREAGAGGPYVKSYAVIQREDTNEQVIVVKCVFTGGFDI